MPPVPRKADPWACVVHLQGHLRAGSIHVIPQYGGEVMVAAVNVARSTVNKGARLRFASSKGRQFNEVTCTLQAYYPSWMTRRAGIW